MNILEYLREQNISISAPCGGNGTCGKCRVSVDGGEPVPACRTAYRPGMDIKVIDTEDDITVLNAALSSDEGAPESVKDSGRYGIAVDIGTTTIAAVLIDMGSGRIISAEAALNPDISFGADVISRIRAGSEGHGREMGQRLRAGLRDIISILITGGIKTGDKKTIDTIAFAGNTTMIHILMDYDLTSLGSFPYKPVNIDIIEKRAIDILQIKTDGIPGVNDAQGVIFPGVSAFIGGDIVSGIYYLTESPQLKNTDDIIAFADLGTNGEMAVITKDRIYCASTAAGPVFEGGGISCGTGSVPGAIDHVKIKETEAGDHEVAYSVIGSGEDQAAGRRQNGEDPGFRVRGICGSGVIDCASQMYSKGICDLHGTFSEDDPSGILDDDGRLKIAEYSDGNPVLFTQDDMRQVQLAKAAVAAGFEELCTKAGISYKDIDALYLAGGMGYAVDIDSAMNIGLLPKELGGCVRSAGNTSLQGVVRFLCGNALAADDLSNILKRCITVDLATADGFQDSFISHIDLP